METWLWRQKKPLHQLLNSILCQMKIHLWFSSAIVSGWCDAYATCCITPLSLSIFLSVHVDVKLRLIPSHSQMHSNHDTRRFISHFHKHACVFSPSSLSLSSYLWLYENNHRNILITVCPFQMQTFSSTIHWHIHTSMDRERGKKQTPSPICAHFSLNMNWPKRPPVEAFLVSAVLGYLIWTQALGSQEFIQ